MPAKKSTRIKTRDYLMVKVINGATKSGVQKDMKKEADRNACDEEVELCRQCMKDAADSDGFCSDSCEEQFDAELMDPNV